MMYDIEMERTRYEDTLLVDDPEYGDWLDGLYLDRAALAIAWLDHVNVTGDLTHHEDEFWNEVPY